MAGSFQALTLAELQAADPLDYLGRKKGRVVHAVARRQPRVPLRLPGFAAWAAHNRRAAGQDALARGADTTRGRNRPKLSTMPRRHSMLARKAGGSTRASHHANGHTPNRLPILPPGLCPPGLPILTCPGPTSAISTGSTPAQAAAPNAKPNTTAVVTGDADARSDRVDAGPRSASTCTHATGCAGCAARPRTSRSTTLSRSSTADRTHSTTSSSDAEGTTRAYMLLQGDRKPADA